MEHQRQTLHDELEPPSSHPVCLALSIATAIDERSTHIDLEVTVEPLLAQHGDERCEEGSSQTRIEDGLDVGKLRVRACPWRITAGLRRRVHAGGVGRHPKEIVAQLGVIGLKLGLDGDDEGGYDRGEQSSLFPKRQYNIATEADERPTKIKVMSKSPPYLSRNSLS